MVEVPVVILSLHSAFWYYIGISLVHLHIMGVRRKISIGFVIIAAILLFSGVVSLYEFASMRRSITSTISDNISSINSSFLLQDVTDEYNYFYLTNLGNDTLTTLPDLAGDSRFKEYMSNVREKYTTSLEKSMADSVMYAYTAYVHTTKSAKHVWRQEYKERRNWYFNKLYPIYEELRYYIISLSHISQNALYENTQNLSDSFYRGIMPGVVAIFAGLLLIILFNFFVNFYFIEPIVKIIDGIKKYISYKKNYTVTVQSDDELGDLNECVREIIETNKLLTANKKGK